MQIIHTHGPCNIEGVFTHTGPDADMADAQILTLPFQGTDHPFIAPQCGITVAFGQIALPHGFAQACHIQTGTGVFQPVVFPVALIHHLIPQTAAMVLDNQEIFAELFQLEDKGFSARKAFRD